MLELLWVSNEVEAQDQNTRRTLLWERWSRREQGAYLSIPEARARSRWYWKPYLADLSGHVGRYTPPGIAVHGPGSSPCSTAASCTRRSRRSG
jgi:hypothetical protein